MIKLESFYSESNELMHYKRAIDEIMRQKAHTLSVAEENIPRSVQEMVAAPENIFSMFNNADIKFPYITDVEGNKNPYHAWQFHRFFKQGQKPAQAGVPWSV